MKDIEKVFWDYASNISIWHIVGALILSLLAVNLYWFIAINIFKKKFPRNEELSKAVEFLHHRRRNGGSYWKMLFKFIASSFNFVFLLFSPLISIIVITAILIGFWIKPFFFFIIVWLIPILIFVGFGLAAIFSFVNWFFQSLYYNYFKSTLVYLLLHILIVSLVIYIFFILVYSFINYYRGTEYGEDGPLAIVIVPILDFIKPLIKEVSFFDILWLRRIIYLFTLLVLWLIIINSDSLSNFFSKRIKNLDRYIITKLYNKKHYKVLATLFGEKNDGPPNIFNLPIKWPETEKILEIGKFAAYAEDYNISPPTIDVNETQLEDYIFVINCPYLGKVQAYLQQMSFVYQNELDNEIPKSEISIGSIIYAGQPFLSHNLHNVKLKSPVTGIVLDIDKAFLPESRWRRYKWGEENFLIKIRPFKGQAIPKKIGSILFDDTIKCMERGAEINESFIFWSENRTRVNKRRFRSSNYEKEDVINLIEDLKGVEFFEEKLSPRYEAIKKNEISDIIDQTIQKPNKGASSLKSVKPWMLFPNRIQESLVKSGFVKVIDPTNYDLFYLSQLYQLESNESESLQSKLNFIDQKKAEANQEADGINKRLRLLLCYDLISPVFEQLEKVDKYTDSEKKRIVDTFYGISREYYKLQLGLDDIEYEKSKFGREDWFQWAKHFENRELFSDFSDITISIPGIENRIFLPITTSLKQSPIFKYFGHLPFQINLNPNLYYGAYVYKGDSLIEYPWVGITITSPVTGKITRFHTDEVRIKPIKNYDPIEKTMIFTELYQAILDEMEKMHSKYGDLLAIDSEVKAALELLRDFELKIA